MPEMQDTKNTTDQSRSGGAQTQESDREGQGANQQTSPDSGIQNQDRPGMGENGGYGKQPGDREYTEGRPAANVQPDESTEPGGGKFADEMQRRNEARDSKHTQPPAQEWSPGSRNPNT